MGDISIIARRRRDGNGVQYGRCGNGGSYSVVGSRLLAWYKDPEKVEYLFGLGQLKRLGKPYSECGGMPGILTHQRICEPHWLGGSEREIFDRISFAAYGYFYDTDDRWYYVIPGPFRIKIPLEYIARHVNVYDEEDDAVCDIRKQVAVYILQDCYERDPGLKELVVRAYGQDITIMRKAVLADADDPLYHLWENYREIYAYFDDWIVVQTTDDMREINGMIVRKRQEGGRPETNCWGDENYCEKIKNA